MKVSEMEGALLDYWVARANKYDHGLRLEAGVCIAPAMSDDEQLQGIASGSSDIYSPSRYWEQAGPIIERECIAIFAGDGGKEWGAEMRKLAEHWIDTTVFEADARGQTPLIAAMRAYVASKFGDEVED